jgi:branched-chain amino acid transport system ATP-binding protein
MTQTAIDILKVSDINVAYGSSQVLFDMSLQVRQGETLALLGRNGAGKSTTMKAIAGVIPTKSGRIQLQGLAVQSLPSHRIARMGIGFVPEDRQIFPDLTVDDNLQIAIKASVKGDFPWTLERVYEMLPLLGPLKQRLGGQLSGGEQQMLTVGRCLMGNPTVILLDEPSEGLAPIMVQRIGRLIADLKSAGTTIVLAEQNLHFCLGLADRAVVIDRGKDVFIGTIKELDQNEAVKRKYLSV